MAKSFWPPKRDRKGFKWIWSARREYKGREQALQAKWLVNHPGRAVVSMPCWNDDYWRQTETLSLLTIPDALYPLIGAVAAYWGKLEIAMDELLAPFVEADANPEDAKWRRSGFTHRKKLLRKKVMARFPGAISDEIRCILAAAAAYHWQRNLAVHGQFVLKFDKGVVSVLAHGNVGKRYVEMEVTEAHLERMYHELGMLVGRISNLTKEDDPKGRLRLSSLDRQTLRAFAERYRPPDPNPHRQRPQHPTF